MAVTLIAHTKTDATGVPATSAAIDTTGANLIVVGMTANGAIPTNAISDSKGNTWVPLTAVSGTARYGLRMFYTLATNVGPGHTFTDSSGISNGSMIVAAFSSVAGFLSQSSGTSAAGATSLNAGSLTPPVDHALIVTACGIDDPAGNTMACTGFSVIDTFDVVVGSTYGLSMAYQVQVFAATVNPAWTRSASNTQSGDLGQDASFSTLSSLPYRRAVSHQQRRAA